jgi:hypothetical protein
MTYIIVESAGKLLCGDELTRYDSAWYSTWKTNAARDEYFKLLDRVLGKIYKRKDRGVYFL